MRKQHNKDTQDEIKERKPTAVTVHSYGSGLLDGTPRSGFTISSRFKVIVAGPLSRAVFRGSTFQTAGMG